MGFMSKNKDKEKEKEQETPESVSAIPEIDTPGEGDINLDAVVPKTEEKPAQTPLEAMTAERDELKDKLLRALAETENIRSRSEREIASARKYGHGGFARDLLGAVDNLARAVDALPDEGARAALDEATRNLVIGVEMVSREMGDILARHGITPIVPMGEKFDPDRHQAMFEKPDPDAEAGTVVEMVRRGWMLHDRLLSPAMVGVAKKPDNKDDDTQKQGANSDDTGDDVAAAESDTAP